MIILKKDGVRKFFNLLLSDESMWRKSQDVPYLQELIHQQDQEIFYLNQMIDDNEEELRIMKSSKLWKLWKKCKGKRIADYFSFDDLFGKAFLFLEKTGLELLSHIHSSF